MNDWHVVEEFRMSVFGQVWLVPKRIWDISYCLILLFPYCSFCYTASTLQSYWCSKGPLRAVITPLTLNIYSIPMTVIGDQGCRETLWDRIGSEQWWSDASVSMNFCGIEGCVKLHGRIDWLVEPSGTRAICGRRFIGWLKFRWMLVKCVRGSGMCGRFWGAWRYVVNEDNALFWRWGDWQLANSVRP